MKEQLAAIPGLELNGVIEDMSDIEVNRYIRLLNIFVEHFHEQESIVNSAFKQNDYDLLSSTLRIIMGTLTSIHADDLLNEFKKLINNLNNAEFRHHFDEIEVCVNSLMSSSSALAIDIQMLKLRETLPEEISAAEQLTLQAESAGKEVIDILAVDDASFFLHTLKTALQGKNYKMSFLKSGEDALRFLSNHVPRLFILDIEMPEMNGFQLAQKIRAAGHKSPIIFMTGNSKKEYVLKAMQSGGNDFIVKPINVDNVHVRVKKQLGD